MPRAGHVSRWDAWNPEQDDALRQLAGTMPLADVAAELSRRFGVPRTVAAVRIRCKRLGVSAWARGWSLRDLERFAGVDHRVIVRWWIEPGLLRARRWDGRGPHAGWWIDVAEIERFVREAPWAYDPARLRVERVPRDRRTEAARLRSIALTVHAADPWRSYAELRQYLGMTLRNLDRWRERGLIPHRRRPKSGPGHGHIMIRGRDFPAIRAAIERAREQARRVAIERAIRARRARAAPPPGRWVPVTHGTGWVGWRLEVAS